MGKKHRKKSDPTTKASPPGSDEGFKGRQRADAHRGSANNARSPSWLETHGRDLRFLLIFGILMANYAATTTEAVKDGFFPWYLTWTTRASAGVLTTFGYDDVEVVKGKSLVSERGWITVGRGCDAVAPTALFVSAVVASPAPVLSKLIAVLGGTFILMAVNLVRVITLFLTRIHWSKAFDVMHLDIWQAAFIFLAIVLWAFWASWTTRRRKRRSDVRT